jgi:hypothetical protein
MMRRQALRGCMTYRRLLHEKILWPALSRADPERLAKLEAFDCAAGVT